MPAFCLAVPKLRLLLKEEKVFTSLECVFYREKFSICLVKEEPKLFPLNSLFDAGIGKNVTIK
jgi:hypothetical protein